MNNIEIDEAVVAVLALDLSSSEREHYRELLKDLSSPAELLTKKDLSETLSKLQHKLNSLEIITKTREDILRWQREGINIVAFGTPAYPRKLSFIHDAPLALFYKGELPKSLNEGSTLAVVGSRKADLTICKYAYDLARSAAEIGLCVISGLAYGIDARAHHGALDSKVAAATVAVLGSGLKHLYPAIHRDLAKRIIDNGGALISQFLPDVSPLPPNFLNRNRIIAGLSDGVLVIQAGERSGSLSTARYAMEEGRDVLVCPGAYGDKRFAGSHRLIKQGAYLVSEFDDIATIFPEMAKNVAALNEEVDSAEGVSSDTAEILALLKDGPLEIEYLLDKLPDLLNPQQKLLELELSEKIICLPGNKIAKA